MKPVIVKTSSVGNLVKLETVKVEVVKPRDLSVSELRQAWGVPVVPALPGRKGN